MFSMSNMNEYDFWALIESAWQTIGAKQKARQALAEGTASETQAWEFEEDGYKMVAALEDKLRQLNQHDLLRFDRILEKKLYDIDRVDIHDHTDGSDDGFLYARGFIVAIGQEYYDAVVADPSKAICDAECESMCFVARVLYEQNFGDIPASGISRESGSNSNGWAGVWPST